MARISMARLGVEAWPKFTEEHAKLFDGSPKGTQLESRLNAAFLAGCDACEAGLDDILKGQSRLTAMAPELLESCKELRDVYSVCLRVIMQLGGETLLAQELKAANVKPSAGARANDVISRAEQ